MGVPAGTLPGHCHGGPAVGVQVRGREGGGEGGRDQVGPCLGTAMGDQLWVSR